MHSNTIVIMVWAWMLSSWSALEHDRYYGLGMDALKIESTRTRSLLWFGHGCSQCSSAFELESIRKRTVYVGSVAAAAYAMRCRSCAVCGRCRRREVLARRRCRGAVSAAMIPKRRLRALHAPAPPPTENGESAVDCDRNSRDPPLASAATCRKTTRGSSTTKRILRTLHAPALPPAENGERVSDYDKNSRDLHSQAPAPSKNPRRHLPKSREGRRFEL